MSAAAPSLRGRLHRQFLLLGVTPVLLVFGAAWALLVPALVGQAESRNRELALAVRDQVQLQLDTRARTVAVLGDLLREAPLHDVPLQLAMQALLRGDRFAQAVYVADGAGRVVEAALPPDSGRFADDAIGLDLSVQPYFVQARRSGQPVWSDAILSTPTGQITAVLALPAGTHTVVLELSLATLSQSVSDLAQSGSTQVVVVDRLARIVAHPDARRALQQENLRQLPLVAAALRGETGSARVAIDGADSYAHALPVAPIGWAVFVAQPVSVVMAPVLRLGGVILAALLATVAVAVGVGWRLARRTGDEVARLADGAQLAAETGTSPPALSFSNAEFNAVWTRLRDLFQQLHLRDQQTRSAERDLQAVLDAATEVAIIATDTAGRVQVFNIGAQRMLGWRAAEVVGRLTPVAWHDEAEVRARGQVLSRKHGQAIAGVEVFFVETRHSGYEVRDWTFHRRDGSTLHVSLAVTPMRTPDGDLKGFLGVAIDVTERRRAAELELARQSAEVASQAKSDFLSQMSHELRTPLNAILGYAQLIDTDPEHPPTARQHEAAGHIQRAGWHLVRLIDDMLDLARIESGRLRLSIAPVGLRALVEQVVQLVAPQMRQLQVTLLAPPPPAGLRVAADATRLTQVLVNLLGNAAKYNRPQGRVTLDCRAADGSVVLCIEDTGHGMTPEQLAQLFEPFNRLGRETSGIEGTGIGLVITRHLVELMGGTLQLRSEAGIGTTVRVTLPAAAEAAADAGSAAATGFAAAPPGSRGRVLYIEDNEVNAQLMRAILRQRPDIDLQVCDRAASGLAAARAAPPRLILLDMHLPDAKGDAVLAMLRADDRLRRVPVVVVSADATRSQVAAMLQRGVQAYLTKPLDVVETLRVVDQALEQALAAD